MFVPVRARTVPPHPPLKNEVVTLSRGATVRAHIAAPAVATRGLCSESLTLRVTTRLDALYDHLLAAGLSSASELLFGGCSAGGLTVYMHADYVASRMPPSVKMAALADAMFSVYSTDVKGQLSYPERMGWIFKAMNSSASVNQACLARIPHFTLETM